MQQSRTNATSQREEKKTNQNTPQSPGKIRKESSRKYKL